MFPIKINGEFLFKIDQYVFTLNQHEFDYRLSLTHLDRTHSFN